MEARMLANVTETASGIVFAGNLRGTFYAINTDDETVLWRRQLGGPAAGGLITYDLDGKQYVAAVFGPVSVFFGGGKRPAKLAILASPG